MLIDLNEILTVDGKSKCIDAELGFEVYASKLGEFPIRSAKPVSLKITNNGERKLELRGSTALELIIPCDRCLSDVVVPMELTIERELDMNQSDEDRCKALDEQNYLEGYNLDVDKLVCSEILVSWPSKVLCQEDCKGLCPTCGTNLNLRTCGCETTDLDPRMAKIQEIFNKFKEV